jgi:hypothetical protein
MELGSVGFPLGSLLFGIQGLPRYLRFLFAGEKYEEQEAEYPRNSVFHRKHEVYFTR